MKVSVPDKKVSKIIDDNKELIRTIGDKLARMVKRRRNELEASNNFKEYLDMGIGDPHPLQGNLDNYYGIRLDKDKRLIVEPVSVKLDDESLRKCEEVNLKGVVHYHDGKCENLIP
nr:type II toxin-antitoxin system YoeB family toxin [Bacilli bacterium]